MEKTKIYLNYLAKDEKVRMTDVMPFLHGGNDGKDRLIAIANEVYGGDARLELAHDNGKSAWGSVSNYRKAMYFYTVIQFEKKDLTEHALSVLGQTTSSSFPYYYAISLCKEDRRLYLVSFQDECSPNWNGRYDTQHYVELEEVDFPVLQDGCFIYRMDDALHAAINGELWGNKSTFTASSEGIRLAVKDQHGNYTTIEGATLDGVFRDYTDNYTGYRNYRRQMASEWEIVSDKAKASYEEWKKTAKGLKSDFDKFYGGGIVD